MPDVSCVECFLLIDDPLVHKGRGPLCRRCYRYKVQLREHAASHARIAQLEAELAEARKDAGRYRYVRDVAFQYANVSLSGNDDNGTAFVIFEPKIYLPDLPNGLRYEEEDWDKDKIDLAIDAAIKASHAD